jgi:nucleoside-diphosphate kinase
MQSLSANFCLKLPIDRIWFCCSQLRMCHLSQAEAMAFYQSQDGNPTFKGSVDLLSSDRSVALEIVTEGCIDRWLQLLGPSDPQEARSTAPDTIRAHFGRDEVSNACHGSESVEAAARELAFFFGPGKPGKCIVGKGTTLGVIKPHLLKDGCAGLALDAMLDSFQVVAMEMFKLDKTSAAEFYEVYKGVLAPGEFHDMVEELTSGPCVAFEVADHDGADPVEAFRELCGPMDPEIGRVLRPNSIRAQFGISKVKNGIHCTDLPEDGQLEVNYFFNILQV